MTPATRLRAALATLGWSQRHLAVPLGANDRLTRLWCAGRADPPPEVLAWVEGLAAHHEAHPPPEGWRRRGFGR